MLGLKRGEIILCDHRDEWDSVALKEIQKLKEIFENYAVDVQLIGSTAIRSIKAKPMLDIAVAVSSFDGLENIYDRLKENGIYKSSYQPIPGIVWCAVKENIDSDIVLYNIHIVVIDSPHWINHLNFRDYLNTFPQKATEYEDLKVKLAKQYPFDRTAYTDGKKEFIEKILIEAEKYYKTNSRL